MNSKASWSNFFTHKAIHSLPFIPAGDISQTPAVEPKVLADRCRISAINRTKYFLCLRQIEVSLSILNCDVSAGYRGKIKALLQLILFLGEFSVTGYFILG